MCWRHQQKKALFVISSHTSKWIALSSWFRMANELPRHSLTHLMHEHSTNTQKCKSQVKNRATLWRRRKAKNADECKLKQFFQLVSIFIHIGPEKKALDLQFCAFCLASAFSTCARYSADDAPAYVCRKQHRKIFYNILLDFRADVDSKIASHTEQLNWHSARRLPSSVQKQLHLILWTHNWNLIRLKHRNQDGSRICPPHPQTDLNRPAATRRP